ncbi:MAG: hypothetical protein AAF298_12430 [Cyanobacteria bacterium P01_A01_bin.40]
MSVIVVGILGFGVVQVLRLTQEEGSQQQARSETTRAMDFITDEIRRASQIDNDASNATSYTSSSDEKVVLALNIPEFPGDRIVYYLKDTDIDPWEGPQVLYRWGPPLNADGSYGTGGWGEEALIDKIDNTTVPNSVISNICPTGSGVDDRQVISPADSPSGFYACIQYGNNNGFTENLADVNGDGRIDEIPTSRSGDGYAISDDTNGDNKINNKDGDDLVGISAQVYFTGGADTVAGDNKSNYSTNTQVVARARTPEEENPGLDSPSQVFFDYLGATYGCDPSNNSSWTMRTDFANDISAPNRSTKWVDRGEDRQPQPLRITNTTLEITSVPIDPEDPSGNDVTTCLNDSDPSRIRGNRNLSETDPLYEADGTPTTNNLHTVKHVVDFDDPTTFNGLEKDNPSRDDKFVMGSDQRVVFLKEGTLLNENFLTRGYDPDANEANNDTTDSDQISLGEFLKQEGYATGDADSGYTITNLEKNERIVAFEIGWEDSTQPGFDLQDNVFLMRTDLFTREFESSDF